MSTDCVAVKQKENVSILGMVMKTSSFSLAKPWAEDLGGLELIHLSNDDDLHVTIAAQQPTHTLTVSYIMRNRKRHKVTKNRLSLHINTHLLLANKKKKKEEEKEIIYWEKNRA